MDKEKDVSSSEGWRVPDIRWGTVALGYATGLAGTFVVGLPLLVIMGSSWLMALTGSIGLFVGGALVGIRVGSSLAVVNGALTAILLNLTVGLAFFIGSFFQVLPEPLPGLPQGDSIFFFAWPLAQFAIGTLSAIMASRIFADRHGRTA